MILRKLHWCNRKDVNKMDSMKMYEKACDIVDELLRQGKTSEEIYVEYTNKLYEEYEKVGTGESSRKNKDLYGEITGIVANRLAKEAVRKAGYQMVEGKRFTFWEKKEKCGNKR